MSLSLWGQANAFDTDDAPKTISLAPSDHPDATSDSTDCNADDFVIASLLVADPGGKLYSVMGHACIRMQCPAYGLYYCLSYESEDVAHRVAEFFAGKLYMGMFAVPKEEYCASYREEGRGVYEYTLNLPIEIKRELWRILDEEMLKGCQQPYDYFHRGCAISCVRFVEQAIGNNGSPTTPTFFNPRETQRISLLNMLKPLLGQSGSFFLLPAVRQMYPFAEQSNSFVPENCQLRGSKPPTKVHRFCRKKDAPW